MCVPVIKTYFETKSYITVRNSFQHIFRGEILILNLTIKRTADHFANEHHFNNVLCSSTLIWCETPPVEEEGAEEVSVLPTGYKKQRMTLMLTVLADGSKLPPYIIFKHKLVPKKISNKYCSASTG